MSYNGGRRGRSPAQNINRGSPRGGSRGGRGKKRVNRSFDSNTSFMANYSPDDLAERKKLNKKKRRHSLSTFSDLYSDINVNFKDCFRVEPSPSQKPKSGKKNKPKKPKGPVAISSPATPFPNELPSSNRGRNRGSPNRGRGGRGNFRGNFRGNRRGSIQPQVYLWDYSKDEEKEEKDVNFIPLEAPKAKPEEFPRESEEIENEMMKEMQLNIIDESSEESESESESSGSEGLEDDEEEAEFNEIFGTQKLEEALGAIQGEVVHEVSGESSDYSYDELDDEPDDDLIIELSIKDNTTQSAKSKLYKEEINKGFDHEEDDIIEEDESDSGTDEEALADYMANSEYGLDAEAISNLMLYDNYSSDDEITEEFLFDDEKAASKNQIRRGKYSRTFVEPGEMDDDIELVHIKEGVQGLLSSNPSIGGTNQPRNFKQRLALTMKENKKEMRQKRKEKKKRRKNKGFNLAELNALNKTIRAFLQDDGMRSVPFAPMNRCQRLQFHNLCNCYGLKTKSFGSGSNRFPSVYKTQSSTLVPMATVVSTIEFLSAAAIDSLKQSLVSLNPLDPVNKVTPTIKSGVVVGQYAPPIDDSNLGSKILQKMGWSGGGLGASGQGIENPIAVIFKNNKRGLGFQ